MQIFADSLEKWREQGRDWLWPWGQMGLPGRQREPGARKNVPENWRKNRKRLSWFLRKLNGVVPGKWFMVGCGGRQPPILLATFTVNPVSGLRCFVTLTLYSIIKSWWTKTKSVIFFFLMGEIGFHVTREKIFAYLCTPPFLYVRLSLLNSTEVI